MGTLIRAHMVMGGKGFVHSIASRKDKDKDEYIDLPIPTLHAYAHVLALLLARAAGLVHCYHQVVTLNQFVNIFHLGLDDLLSTTTSVTQSTFRNL